MPRSLAYLPAVVLGLSFLAHGQAPGSQPRPPTGSPTKGTIEAWFAIGGRVLYAARLEPATQVKVSLLRTTGALAGVAFTDPRGEFDFHGLSRAVYVVEVIVEGFQPVHERVDLYLGSRRDVTILLEPKLSTTDAPSSGVLAVGDFRIPEKARKAFEKGTRELHDNGKPERSLSYLREAIAFHPTYDEAYVQLGLAHIARGEHEHAQQVLQKAVQVNPSNARAFMVLGTVYNSQRRPQEALQPLQRALALDESAWQVHYELGKSFEKLGKIEEAYKHARRAYELNSLFPSVHLLYYNLCIQRGDYKTALGELEQFITRHPTNPLIPQLRQKRDALQEYLATSPK